jgi:ADP-heptose:LPS heptosyltransferase
MPRPLFIQNRWERAAVRLVDGLLAPLAWRTPATIRHARRILLLRLERIGDLLMTLEAIGAARTAWPHAEIDLAVGSWNTTVAALIPDVTRVETVNVPWLARHDGGDGWPALVARTRRWRTRRYDLVINFEPDIRSNLLAWLSGAPVRAGYSSGGGGPFLTHADGYDPARHVSVNATTLVGRVAALTGARVAAETPPRARLRVPDEVCGRVRALLGTGPRPYVGVHVSGGRESKQWHLSRFAQVARELARTRRATIVLTGTEQDRPLIDRVARELSDAAVVDVGGRLGLVELAGLLQQLDLLVTGDTGPMHLAAAVGTPVVALFGPSNPARYGPRAAVERIVRVDLPCSPCGLVRRPPTRCRGHVPDCMDGISAERVTAAALDLLDAVRSARALPR